LKIEEEINQLSKELALENVAIIPVSATEGDNVTKSSANLPWYSGQPLLTYLEEVDVESTLEEEGFYMPVQRVCRPNHTFRGFQGQIEAGDVSVGDEITTLPSNEVAIVKSIHVTDKEVQSAGKNQPVTIQLNKEVDVSRGCVITKDAKLIVGKSFVATILWMDDSQLTAGKNYFVKLGTKMLPGVVTEVKYKIDVNTGEHLATGYLKKNEIAVCEISLVENIVMDQFDTHKTLGELILIDRISNMTSACGVIDLILDEEKNQNDRVSFAYNDIKARGDIFEEFYYNTESLSLSKYKPAGHTYTVGDEIPVKGESYEYPEDFDVLVLRDWVAIKIRNKKIAKIEPIDDYKYSGAPVANGRGFAVNVNSTEEVIDFLEEYKAINNENEAKFLNDWVNFETYRKVIFHSNYWVI